MGTYISQSDVTDIFGTVNVTKWSDLENAGEISTATVTAAIAWAEAHVESFFRDGRYAVPLTGTSGTLPKTVVNWCATLAGWKLYVARGLRDAAENGDDGNRMGALRKFVEDEIRHALMGRRLAMTANETAGPTAPFIVGGG